MKRLSFFLIISLLIASLFVFAACGVRDVIDNLSKDGVTPDECFDFKAVEGGYSISAHYTDLMPARVVIPSTHEGKDVVSIKNEGFKELKITEVEIPSTVKTVGFEAFRDCRNLTTVTLAEGVSKLEDYAFYGCESLESITIPDTVTDIGDLVFRDCESLTEIVIPDSVTTLAYGAFRACASLRTVTIGKGLTKLDEYIFDGCSSLSVINYRGTMAEWNALEKAKEGWNDWDSDTGAYTIRCTDGDITK